MKNKFGLLFCESLKDEIGKVLSGNDFPDMYAIPYARHCTGKIPGHDPIEEPFFELVRKCDRIIIIGCGCTTPIRYPVVPMESQDVTIADIFSDIFFPDGLFESYQREGGYCIVSANLIRCEDFFRCQGFDKKTTRSFLAESVHKIVCADTLLTPQTGKLIQNLSIQLGIPIERIPVGTRPLHRYLHVHYLLWKTRIDKIHDDQIVTDAHRKTADYAMMIDLLGEVTTIQNEEQVIEKILDIFIILFSPQKIGFLGISEKAPDMISCRPKGCFNDTEEKSFFSHKEEYGILESGTGFFITLLHDRVVLGTLVLDGLSVPDRVYEYLDLSQFIIKVCGLALVNARQYQQIESTVKKLSDEITQRKKIEEELNLSETRYRSLVESTSDIIWEADLNGQCIYISPRVESVLGYKQDEITGHILSDYLRPEDVPRFKEGYARFVQEKTSISVDESIFLHKDGYPVILESNGVPVHDTSGKIQGFRGISRDITERKQKDDALRLASKKLNLLSSITRHDILNSLTAMLGYLKFSQESVKDTEMVSGYLDKMMQITEMIQHQIEFTRYYEDIGIKAPEWQDIESIIKQAAHSLKLDGVAIKIQVHGLLVFCDALIDKVFYNLIENTIRHGEHVTTITISCHLSGTDLVLVYADDGVGVAEKDKANIFLRGFGKHTGFGMFLTKEILSITGISIREMGTPGEGVRFEMVIPEGKYQSGDMQSP